MKRRAVGLGVALLAFACSTGPARAQDGTPKDKPADGEKADLEKRVAELEKKLAAVTGQPGGALPNPEAKPPVPAPGEKPPEPPPPPPPGSLSDAFKKIEGLQKGIDDIRKDLPFTFHGGTYLWYYQPFQPTGAEALFEDYATYLLFDFPFTEPFFGEEVGFHFEPRFRTNSKLRGYFQSNVWIQEVYAYIKIKEADAQIKIGKIHERLGRFWDTGTWYGSIPYFDGLKLDPHYGISLEGGKKLGDMFGVDYSLQYFLVDGEVNGSLNNRDTVSIAGARKRNMVVGTVAPYINIADVLKVTVGAFGEWGRRDFKNSRDDNDCIRMGTNLEVKVGPFTDLGITWMAYAEATHQHGMNTTDYPTVGARVHSVDYFLTGTSLSLWRLSFYVNYSHARYGDYNDVSVEENMWSPGLYISLHKNIAVEIEYMYWFQHIHRQNGSPMLDNSLNCILDIHW
ncbi:hypothetical protein HY251_00815 [bacterium]|nr:hypothetical protein [bacterium]